MKKLFSIIGMIVSIAIVAVGVMAFTGTLLFEANLTTASMYNASSYSSYSSRAVSKYNDVCYAHFGADFYTYVNNNAAKAAYYAQDAAGYAEDAAHYAKDTAANSVLTYKLLSIVVIAFGAFGICLFGYFLGGKKGPAPATSADQLSVPIYQSTVPAGRPVNPNFAPLPRTNGNHGMTTENLSVPQESMDAETEAQAISNELKEQLKTEDKPISTLPSKKSIGIEIKTLPEMLAYAAKFTSDPGMTGYLQREKDKLPEEDSAKVEELLKLPPKEIREAIKKMV